MMHTESPARTLPAGTRVIVNRPTSLRHGQAGTVSTQWSSNRGWVFVRFDGGRNDVLWDVAAFDVVA